MSMMHKSCVAQTNYSLHASYISQTNGRGHAPVEIATAIPLNREESG
jgi:hypothetical protein